MIYNYPFSSASYMHYPNARNYYITSRGNMKHRVSKNIENASSPNTTSNQSSISTSFNKKKEENSELLEIFGIKLYFDDILLICLIFFLYNEGVKDQTLFIILILLLLN